MRFGKLRKEVEGITKKMLTQTLRRLERDGLISRSVISNRPLAVQYQLTRLGRDVVPVVVKLKGWAEKNWQAIHEANESFDADISDAAKGTLPPKTQWLPRSA